MKNLMVKEERSQLPIPKKPVTKVFNLIKSINTLSLVTPVHKGTSGLNLTCIKCGDLTNQGIESVWGTKRTEKGNSNNIQ